MSKVTVTFKFRKYQRSFSVDEEDTLVLALKSKKLPPVIKLPTATGGFELINCQEAYAIEVSAPYETTGPVAS